MGAWVNDKHNEGTRASEFSIITAAYNSSATIAATIESVLAQDFDDWELVVVDDGSTDDTVETVLRAAAGDPRVRVMSKENGGSASARNVGIANSSGEFVCVLDSDDRYQTNYLSNMHAFIERYPNRDLYSCNGDFVFPQGFTVKVRKGRRFLHEHAFTPEEMLDANLVFIMATIRRTALERIGGFRPELRTVEDYDTWMRILLTGGTHMYNPARLGLYGLTDGSQSSHFDRIERTRLEILEYLAEEYPDAVARQAYDYAIERQRMRVELAAAERRVAQGDSRGMRRAFFAAWPVLPTRMRKYVGGVTVLASPQLYRRVFLGRLYPPLEDRTA